MDKKEKHLLFFSGGIDSTTLLEYFLKKSDIDLYVCYLSNGFTPMCAEYYDVQTKHAHRILDVYKKKGYEFKLLEGKIQFNFLGELGEKDKPGINNDRWIFFFAGMICKRNNIKKFWVAMNSYTDHFLEQEGLGTAVWYEDGSLMPHVKLGFQMENCPTELSFEDIELCYPKKNFNRTGIDNFTQVDMYNYIDKEVKSLVRSCESVSNHRCSESPYCVKCHKDIQSGVANIKGELII